MNNIKFTGTGIVAGFSVGLATSLISGNIMVAIMIGALGLIVGDIFGFSGRNGS